MTTTIPTSTISYNLTSGVNSSVLSSPILHTNGSDITPTYTISTTDDVKTYPDIYGDFIKFATAGEQVPGKTLSDLYINLIDEEYTEFLHGIKTNDKIEILDGLVDTIYVLMGYCYANGIDFYGAWNEIQASNMSKMDPLTGKAIKNEAGKIQKPASYFKPNLIPFV